MTKRCPHCAHTVCDDNFPKKVVQIVRDDDPQNPRRDYDQFGVMACFHKRYDLGDEGHGIRSEDFDGWDEMKQHIWDELDAAVVLPMYMYGHSGITVNTTGFSCPWDSGQIGFIFITNKQLAEEYPKAQVESGEALEIAKRLLIGEVETYDNYLTGACYGYRVIDEDGEETDSCWGFIGDDHKTNGIMDNVQSYLDDGYELEEAD